MVFCNLFAECLQNYLHNYSYDNPGVGADLGSHGAGLVGSEQLYRVRRRGSGGSDPRFSAVGEGLTGSEQM